MFFIYIVENTFMNKGSGYYALPLVMVLFAACTKEVTEAPATAALPEVTAASKPDARRGTTTYTRYLIRKGNHYCDQNTLRSISTSEMKFTAKFNSSAIYTTVDPVNQYDINKLWGFSEGVNHQYNSARVGWAYNNSALRLYAYVYSKGVRYSQEIGPVNLNTDIACSIRLNGSTYVFNVNGVVVSMPRGGTGTKASGYQLYPYFGGDETAPQDISIDIK